MTITAEIINSPKLREKDGYCALSYFDGHDVFSATATVGNYVNTGSLGNLSDLRLIKETTSVRQFVEGINGITVPLLNPSLYGHGLTTAATSNLNYTEFSTITVEGWVKQNLKNSVNQFIIGKRYNTGTASPWANPFSAFLLCTDGSLSQYVMFYATSSTTYATVNIGQQIPTNSWVHLGFSWTSGGDIKIYLNGINVKTEASKTMYYGNHGGWSVGGRGGFGDFYFGLGAEGFYGAICGLRVHNVIRSDDWFRETYNLGKNQV